ncbi:MAG: 16S rRNA (adenine(1518)-N(6)/adenine(1519)-N(6))-dimethyltransferase RsmA [Candidatus Magasanikbacteria bacterium]
MENFLKPSILKELCQKYDLSPSKKYGQNYLITDKPVLEMVEAGEIEKTDTVVEIGPGFGVLTFLLAEKAKEVYAFEIEKKLDAYWQEKQKQYTNVHIIWGNVLTHIEEKAKELGTYKVCANLPYQITSFVLRTLLELHNKPERIVIMVQKEVAERMCAKPGDMSLLSVSVQYYGTPRIVTKVSRGNFWPSPKVDSAVVAIEKMQKNTKEDARFFAVVHAGFANKRKQLAKNVANTLGIQEEKVKDALKKVMNNERVRAEELSVENWKDFVTLIYS